MSVVDKLALPQKAKNGRQAYFYADLEKKFIRLLVWTVCSWYREPNGQCVECLRSMKHLNILDKCKQGD
ncbi:hypothetical protein SBF1_2360013 [Candidatus Desulfosporosinus infrequens]|uniref:Uncharacterized protein n=1 Tax=Candidatus Desulfosporosinus infrequens TaxID=2043169 RepID=A0A2U3KMG3_9FIRM|nr:hypothetical protein SBF1_2360013 [Candidatus Desulfosporosinus infrequens]